MKLLVSKDVTGLTQKEVSDFLEEVVATSFDVEIVLFDSNGMETSTDRKKLIFDTPNISSRLMDAEGSIFVVESEEGENLNQKSLDEGVDRGCSAFLHVPRNVTLIKGGDIVTYLFSSMSDKNICSTFCDYNQNGTLMIQNAPVVFCQRITNKKKTPISILEGGGIKKYIPLELYNVYQKN